MNPKNETPEEIADPQKEAKVIPFIPGQEEDQQFEYNLNKLDPRTGLIDLLVEDL